jgi:hypothetical protein
LNGRRQNGIAGRPVRLERDYRAVWFGGGPGIVISQPHSPRLVRSWRSGTHVPTRWTLGWLTAAKRCSRLLPWNWSFPRRRMTVDEAIVSVHGSVEIHLLPAVCVARTCVKGEMDQARTTGLRRLAKYAHGDNLNGIKLNSARRILQQQQASRRWLISVPVATVDGSVTAPCPREAKVKVVPLEAELLAVVRVPGRPTRDSISRGDAIILTGLADTQWITTGAPAIRVDAFGPLAWFRRGFDVVVPVSPRTISGQCPLPG